jgi:hypothetical protein
MLDGRIAHGVVHSGRARTMSHSVQTFKDNFSVHILCGYGIGTFVEVDDSDWFTNNIN